jgi:hypothetical protein
VGFVNVHSKKNGDPEQNPGRRRLDDAIRT